MIDTTFNSSSSLGSSNNSSSRSHFGNNDSFRSLDDQTKFLQTQLPLKWRAAASRCRQFPPSASTLTSTTTLTPPSARRRPDRRRALDEKRFASKLPQFSDDWEKSAGVILCKSLMGSLFLISRFQRQLRVSERVWVCVVCVCVRACGCAHFVRVHKSERASVCERVRESVCSGHLSPEVKIVPWWNGAKVRRFRLKRDQSKISKTRFSWLWLVTRIVGPAQDTARSVAARRCKLGERRESKRERERVEEWGEGRERERETLRKIRFK